MIVWAKRTILHNGSLLKLPKGKSLLSLVLMFKKFHQHFEYVLVSSCVGKSPRCLHSFSKITVKIVKRQVTVLVIWLSLVLMFKKFHQHFAYGLVTSSYVCQFPRCLHSLRKPKSGQYYVCCSLSLTESPQIVENRRKKRNKTKQFNWPSEFLLVVCALALNLFVEIRTIVSYWVFVIFFIFPILRSLQVSSLQPEIATHRPSSLPQLTEFGLAVDERTRNIHARWSKLTQSDL